VATSGGSRQQIQIWEIQTGEAKRLLSGTGAQRWAVGVSSDGRRIAWGETSNYQAHNDRGPLEDQLRLPANAQSLGRPEKSAQAATSWVRARATHETYALAHRRGGAYGKDAILDVQKDGQTLVSIERNSSNGYDHRAYSFTPDGQTIISGGNGWLTAYDLKGQVLGNFVGHESDVWSVTPSPDARLLLSASGDQTIRLWNLKTRELIVTLVSGSNGEWVMWTPQGYYASSPDGDRIVGWQINRGSDHAAEYVNAAQLRDHFYRPDIVERGIILASATAAVAEVGRTRGGTFQLSDLTSRPPPKLSAQLAPGDSETMRGRADIKLVVSETKDDPVKDFDVFVNDTKVTAAATRRGADVSFEVPLGQGNNRIRVVARSTADLLGETMLEIKQNGEGMLDRRDTLFIVAVGVDRYPQMPKTCGVQENEPCDLAFAGADAKAFAETVEKQMGAQHRLVLKRVMFNGAGDKLEPTAANILDTMDLLREAKDTDTVAVFIAGHGFNDPRSGYQFLPTNARPGGSGNWASSSVVSWPTLEASIQAAKGRRLLFVDTCHSGGAYNARLIKDASDGGVVAFSATNTQQYALELTNLGHGAFTHVLMRGMNGEADTAKEKEVRVFDLGTFIEREVRKLTNGRQTPDFYKKPGAENFVMVRM
jgi:WD40 repeat protein